MIRVSLAIADDHELVLLGLARLLAPHHDVRLLAHSGSELVRRLDEVPVQCVLLDLAMPGTSGLDILPHLRDRWPDLRIIMLSMHTDRSLVNTALSLGAHGYVPKNVPVPELFSAIESVLDGKRHVSPRIPRHTEQWNSCCRPRRPTVVESCSFGIK